ncbi:hypothetical protein SAMN06265218_107140 [Fodinibius sediminis]|uniref:Sensor protein FixL n=2 Tax=Fodinibius sediminis TaxID=1214077 RepID=A0A521CVG9_9BACT|nr:hypothetical protein SAMN06265218_107140 [Fodinibius sediminis]
MEKIKRNLPVSAIEILDNISYGVLVLNLEGGILFWNEACEDLFGYSAEEVLEQNILFLYPDRFKDKFKRHLKELKEGRRTINPWCGEHKDGSLIWCNAQTKLIYDEEEKPVAIICSIFNIKEEMALKSKLKRNRARIQAILDNMVEAVISINSRGIIQNFNKSAEKMFGYDSEEVIGKSLKILMPSPHKEQHEQYINNYLETGDQKVIGSGREERARRKDGTIFPMELSVSETMWEGERIFTGIIRDISERRKLENTILKISEDERRRIGQELHDGLGQMLTGLGLISQNVAQKLEANNLPGAQEVKEISELIKDADEYARSLSHSLVPIDLSQEGLRHAIIQLINRAQKLFNIQCEFEEAEIKKVGDNTALHLYRITQEAITNAVKHGSADQIRISLEGSADAIQLCIEDNGAGFSSYTEGQKGLGLKTMQYRAHILGGNLELGETEQGGGQIICSIPYYEQPL